MVGLVLVSHSNALAQAAADLVRQVSTTDFPLAAVGGVGENRTAFGTNAADIVEAIESVYRGDGVLVLMDLGSAVLSSETALELLPDTLKPGVLICEAPLVEGAVAAGVQVSSGGDLETVRREATQALIPKIRHLTGSAELPTQVPAPEPVRQLPAIGQKIALTINTRHGLHARLRPRQFGSTRSLRRLGVGQLRHHRHVGVVARGNVQIFNGRTSHRGPVLITRRRIEFSPAFPAAIDRPQQLFTTLRTDDLHTAIIFILCGGLKTPD